MKQAYLKLKKLRKQKNTQSDISEKIGIPTRVYSKIENEETQLNLDRLTEILDILEISIIDFLWKKKQDLITL